MKPIFIVGVGRSGTSLLQSMLASHSELSFLPETAFIRRYIAKNKLSDEIKNNGVDGALECLKKDDVISRINFDFNIEPNFNEITIDLDCYEAMQLNGMHKQKKTRFGDKDPRLIEYLPTLKYAYPDAFVINIIRDPRDVLCSKKKAAWSTGRSTLFYSFANHVQIKMSQIYGEKLFGDRYIEIIYEDLIDKPESTLKTLCNKLNLSFESRLLNFSSQAQKLVSKDEVSWKKETFGPLLSNNSNKWKTELSKNELALTELSCDLAINLGSYKKSDVFSKLKLKSKISCYFQNIIIKLITPVYIYYRIYTQKRS